MSDLSNPQYDIPGFTDVITEYINHGKNKYNSLYEYIKHIVDCYINALQSPYSLKFLKNIDSRHFDTTHVDRLMFYITTNLYNISYNSIEDAIYIPNTGFKNWCDRWQEIYNKHTPIAKFKKKYMVPYRDHFLERLWNPHTKIGQVFMIKHINKLSWEPT